MVVLQRPHDSDVAVHVRPHLVLGVAPALPLHRLPSVSALSRTAPLLSTTPPPARPHPFPPCAPGLFNYDEIAAATNTRRPFASLRSGLIFTTSWGEVSNHCRRIFHLTPSLVWGTFYLPLWFGVGWDSRGLTRWTPGSGLPWGGGRESIFNSGCCGFEGRELEEDWVEVGVRGDLRVRGFGSGESGEPAAGGGKNQDDHATSVVPFPATCDPCPICAWGHKFCFVSFCGWWPG